MAKDKDDITETIHELMQIMRKTAIKEDALEEQLTLSKDPAFIDIKFILRKVNPKWALEAIARAFLEEQLTWEEYEELDEVCGMIFLITKRRAPNLLQGAKFAAERYINAEVCPIYLHRAQKNLTPEDSISKALPQVHRGSELKPEDLISKALADRIFELEKEKNTVVGFFSRPVKEYKITRLKALKNEFMLNTAALESYFEEALQDKKLIEGKDSRTEKILKYCQFLAAIIEHNSQASNEKEEQIQALRFE